MSHYQWVCSKYFTDGSTFVFLAGNHSLQTVLHLVVRWLSLKKSKFCDTLDKSMKLFLATYMDISFKKNSGSKCDCYRKGWYTPFLSFNFTWVPSSMWKTIWVSWFYWQHDSRCIGKAQIEVWEPYCVYSQGMSLALALQRLRCGGALNLTNEIAWT